MLAWGIAMGLCLAFLCRGAFLWKKIRALEARCAQLDGSLEETAHALEEQNALTTQHRNTIVSLQQSLDEKDAVAAQQQDAIAVLQKALDEKNEALTTLAPPPKPRLYLPDDEEPATEDPLDTVIYYNENTGIYHADRHCAPYQAIEMPLCQVPPQARPCKKCAEGILPHSLLPDDHPQEENQLSLFELSEKE